MVDLTPDRARIFRITHLANVPWILGNGLHCNSATVHDPNFVSIGNADLIAKRTKRVLPPPATGTLDDWISFYFTPFSPMLYNIKTGWNGIQKRPMQEIVLLTSTLHNFLAEGVVFVFSDRHAYLQIAKFSDDPTTSANGSTGRFCRREISPAIPMTRASSSAIRPRH